MSFQDQTLVCGDCGKDFIFTVGEQEFYQQKGFTNTPKRCQDCRSQKKAQRSGGNHGGGNHRDRDRGHGGDGGRGGFGGGRGAGGQRSRGPAGAGPSQRFPATCSRCGAAFDAPFQPKGDRPVFCRPCFDANKGR